LIEVVRKDPHTSYRLNKENNQNFLVTFLTDPKWEQTATMLFITILIAYKHKDNFERIKNNKEHKISFF